MENKISQENATIFADHNLPMQGEFVMKDGDINGKNSLMEAVKLEIEMEKKKIREEIIASEILQRRQELEAEVRMELMMEKQIMGSSDDEIGEKMKLINHTHPIEGGADDSLQIKSHPLKNNVCGDGEKQKMVGLGKWPFERDPNLVLAGKSMAELCGDEVLDQAMPSSGIIGMKRKAETSEVACDEETASVANKDLQKKKWYCSLCEVSATSAGGLNLHLHGKKHKAKEAMSKSGETACSIITDSCSADNSMQPVEQVKDQMQLMEEDNDQVPPAEEDKSQVQPMKEDGSEVQPVEQEKKQLQPVDHDKIQVTKKWECSLCQLSVTSETLLRSHLQGKKHKAMEAKLGVNQGLSDNYAETAKGTSEDAKKWYCSICQVSASSEKNLNDHIKGKKHRAKEGSLLQEAGSMDSDSIDNISEDVKIKSVKNLEGVEGLKSEQETRNTSIEQGKSQVNEQEIVNTLNIVKIGSEGRKQESNSKACMETEELEKSSYQNQEIRRELVKLFHCKMCNEGTYDEAAMANHRKSSKHRNLLQKIGGGVIVVSSVRKEAVNSEKGSQDAALEGNEGVN
ncbi:hypothetical protein BVRB_2g044110 [Beta vulgaris subsp. vulgaris]|nr:hypothetical protein BVRB_2g044110 [Beta vulgaris subsp. vulgaris]